MHATTRINLHCHSTCSDGVFTPEELARRLVNEGVVFAALTDHETIDGAERFRKELDRFGVASVHGVELPVQWRNAELHLLIYGFQLTDAEWLETLRAFRQRREMTTQSVANSLRRIGHVPGDRALAQPETAHYSLPEIIDRAHRARARVFLAHPGLLRYDEPLYGALFSELKQMGMDGVEALYAPSPREQQAYFTRLSQEHGLLVCAGTDYHRPGDESRGGMGVDVPLSLWQPLRDALRFEAVTSSASVSAAYNQARRARKSFDRHILFPSILAVLLFILAIWVLFIPSFERALLERKREMIRELSHSAWSIMRYAEQQEKAGRMTREDAQREAIEHIAALRYGHENKDYFWLQDMQPRMVMHPYRPELNGQDLSGFKDPRGVPIFVEFADLVRRHGEGYVDYVWQWMDDPKRLEPKESYVMGFKPWGWVIGTGVYTEDVKAEIARLERGLVHSFVLITGIVALLLLHVVRYSRRIDTDCTLAVDNLHLMTERYRSLLEIAREGTLLVLDRRCRYANAYLLSLLGYSAGELELLDLSEIVPVGGVNDAIWKYLEADPALAQQETLHLSGELRRHDGSRLPCTLVLSRLLLGGRNGCVLLARESESLTAVVERPAVNDAFEQMAAHVPTGLFTARADSKGTILSANDIARRCLSAVTKHPHMEEDPMRLATLFHDKSHFEMFIERLRRDGRTEAQARLVNPDGHPLTLMIRAALRSTMTDLGEVIDGIIEDTTSLSQREQERDMMIERLQSSLLFLHQPVGTQVSSRHVCPSTMPIHKVATVLIEANGGAVLVQDASGTTVGIATAADLCRRVIASGGDVHAPISTVMSSPVVSVPSDLPVYEALLKMQENKLQHLGVVDHDGRIFGSVCDRDLLPFQQYGAVVLNSQISRASLVEDVIRGCQRTSSTIKALLDSGAHPHNLARLLASVCDTATERFVQLAIEELGPPPARYSFIALGSQGRQEQTLVTDQDNAIIYEDVQDPKRREEAEAYFVALGQHVCSWLNAAGYPLCRGKFMAQNPLWTRDLKAWKNHFSYWAATAESAELMNFAVFFDFRSVCGDSRLVDELRGHVFDEIRESHAFFPHFARHALAFRAPTMFFGRVLRNSIRGLPRTVVDLKAAMLPIVAFARLYALRHMLRQSNTVDRLAGLREKGILSPANHEEMVTTYTFLLRLRFKLQVSQLYAGRTPTNLIDLRSLSYTERLLLQESFTHIRAIQQRVSYDFLGGTMT